MSQIVTLTLNPTVDKSSTVEHVVAERKLRCSEPEYHPGGGGLNVARAVAHLGGDALAYWTCGGAIGQLLKDLLDAESISHQPIEISEMTRENLIVFENSSEQQYRFGMPGAALREEEIQNCINQLTELNPLPDYLVLSGSLPPQVDKGLYARLAEAIPESCRVILDTSGEPLQRGLEASVYLVKPNMHELEQLAGQEIKSDSQIREVAESIIEENKAEVVVTSLGSGGVVFTTSERHEVIRAPMVKIRSKVGAGDSMVAGIVHALSQQKPIGEAVRYGVAAGSAAVETEGTELCRKENTERLFREIMER